MICLYYLWSYLYSLKIDTKPSVFNLFNIWNILYLLERSSIHFWVLKKWLQHCPGGQLFLFAAPLDPQFESCRPNFDQKVLFKGKIMTFDGRMSSSTRRVDYLILLSKIVCFRSGLLSPFWHQVRVFEWVPYLTQSTHEIRLRFIPIIWEFTSRWRMIKMPNWPLKSISESKSLLQMRRRWMPSLWATPKVITLTK